VKPHAASLGIDWLNQSQDGRLKTEFETREEAWTGAEELKKRFPMLRVKVYEAETKDQRRNPTSRRLKSNP
jgi:hypothetical protein